MVKFSRSAVEKVVPDGDRVVIFLEGELASGQPFAGTDTIRVIH